MSTHRTRSRSRADADDSAPADGAGARADEEKKSESESESDEESTERLQLEEIATLRAEMAQMGRDHAAALAAAGIVVGRVGKVVNGRVIHPLLHLRIRGFLLAFGLFQLRQRRNKKLRWWRPYLCAYRTC